MNLDLQAPIKQLKLNLTQSWIAPYLKQLKRELKERGLFHHIHFWISDEWFCPDGITGIAIPFSILDQSLMNLERRMTHQVDGASPRELMKLLRHEAGHVLDNAYGLRRKKKRQKLFGLSSQKYPYCYYPKDNNNEFVSYVYPSYSQAHPDEDWAETFATWLDPKSNWERKYTTGKARKKLDYVNELMGSLAKTKQYKIDKSVMDSYKEIELTLEDYYEKKREKLGFKKSKLIASEFAHYFNKNGSYDKASIFLSRNRLKIISELRENGEINEYQANVVLQKMIAYCREEDLKLNMTTNLLETRISKALMRKWRRLIQRREHKVIM